MALSFLQGRRTSQLTKTVTKGDPLDIAKQKIIRAIQSQKSLVEILKSGRPIPKKGFNGRNIVWFYREADGNYWTCLRYGQSTIPLENNDTYVEVGDLNELDNFYDQVVEAISNGELNEIIAGLSGCQPTPTAPLKTSCARRLLTCWQNIVLDCQQSGDAVRALKCNAMCHTFRGEEVA